MSLPYVPALHLDDRSLITEGACSLSPHIVASEAGGFAVMKPQAGYTCLRASKVRTEPSACGRVLATPEFKDFAVTGCWSEADYKHRCREKAFR